MKKKILIVAAHPDDEILGCGGTIARSVAEGNEVYTLILGEGITSRDSVRDTEKRQGELDQLKEQAKRANKGIGVTKLFMEELPDNRFDSIPFLDIVKIVEKVVKEVTSDVIYTHHHSDLNIDHCITYRAVITACRPISNGMVKEIYSFEVPSSTEWNKPNRFDPNLFIDISSTLGSKIDAFNCYDGEMNKFPHPRSEEAIMVMAKRWGSVSGFQCAEAFEVVRKIK